MNIVSNGLRFEVETAGDGHAPAVLLTMGLGMQLTAWPEQLLTALVGAGYRVIRYDNRDIGWSSHLDELGEPNLLWQFVKSRLGLRLHAAYTLQDMAQTRWAFWTRWAWRVHTWWVCPWAAWCRSASRPPHPGACSASPAS
ncbi:hypothetical protein [Hydrogenophaga sp.]|jgi:pimeloyl-ACP methyl ester carboxylesterase|uniref:alpha/beta fold hydrolase n=1 Tax=Hydrogenophaga sp. TaxID=1904254 RepID=UPI003014EB42